MAMFGDTEILFYTRGDSFGVLRAQENAVKESVASLTEQQILNGSIEDLASFVENKLSIDVPVLDIENAEVDQTESKVMVNNWRYDQPVPVDGTKVTLEIPYTGDEILFHIKPSTWGMNPPRAIVTRSSLTLVQTGTNLNGEEVQKSFDSTINLIQQNLSRLKADFQNFNSTLKDKARGQIQSRKDKLLADKSMVAGLKFKLKQRSDAPKTYTVPIERRKIASHAPTVPTQAKFAPEPVLAKDDYQRILKIIHDMTLVIERSPTSFATMGEEDIRQHFLVQLNGQYEGKATGERFNAQGKTDILVREDDRNIFIAECKFWRGDKSFTDTIDQLLGYIAWRDTKAAIILFNRRT